MNLNLVKLSHYNIPHLVEKSNQDWISFGEDNLYPKVVSEPWIRNNEIYLSYLLERYKIKFNNIGLQWNYILDDLIRRSTAAAHLVHQVNKEFHVTIQ